MFTEIIPSLVDLRIIQSIKAMVSEKSGTAILRP